MTLYLAIFSTIITLIVLLVFLNFYFKYYAEKYFYKIHKDLSNLRHINELEHELLDMEHMKNVPHHICETAVNKWSYTMAWIGLIDPYSKRIKPIAFAGQLDDKIKKTIQKDIEKKIGPTSYCVKEKTCVTLSSYKRYCKKSQQKKFISPEELLNNYLYNSFIILPLIVNKEVIGILSIYTEQEEKHLLIELEKLEAFANLASIAVNNLKKLKEEHKSFQEMVKVLSTIIDARDEYTAFHSANVAKYAVGIAKHLELTKDEINEIEMCGLLHDIGKINVADKILNKQGPLDFTERKLMQTHSTVGAMILNQAKSIFNKKIIDGIKYHHERYDGSGYPQGLRGESIPLYAQILAVADSYDAMTTDRSYRKALPKERAVAELKRNKGKQFSPQIVDAFLQFQNKENQESINGVKGICAI